jgi:hypothetical protein
VQDIAQAVIRYYRKLVPLATSLFADMELMARFRQWMQEQQAGPLNLYELVAGYIEAEQRLGRLNRAIQPFNFTALLLGACFQYVFLQHFQGQDAFPVSEQAYVAGLVQTLMVGGSPEEQASEQ